MSVPAGAPANLMLGVPCDGLASHPGGGDGSRYIPSHFMLQNPG